MLKFSFSCLIVQLGLQSSSALIRAEIWKPEIRCSYSSIFATPLSFDPWPCKATTATCCWLADAAKYFLHTLLRIHFPPLRFLSDLAVPYRKRTYPYIIPEHCTNENWQNVRRKQFVNCAYVGIRELVESRRRRSRWFSRAIASIRIRVKCFGETSTRRVRCGNIWSGFEIQMLPCWQPGRHTTGIGPENWKVILLNNTMSALCTQRSFYGDASLVLLDSGTKSAALLGIFQNTFAVKVMTAVQWRFGYHTLFLLLAAVRENIHSLNHSWLPRSCPHNWIVLRLWKTDNQENLYFVILTLHL